MSILKEASFAPVLLAIRVMESLVKVQSLDLNTYKNLILCLNIKPFTDVDECAGANLCDVRAVCSNTEGSYTCQCEEGYSGNGTHCEGTYMLCCVVLTCLWSHTLMYMGQKIVNHKMLSTLLHSFPRSGISGRDKE